MRTGIDKTIDALIRKNVCTEDIVAFLAENLTAKEMTEELARALQENRRLRDNMPVVMRISQSDFDKHFRIIGTRADGTKEQRGSNRWKKEE